MSLWESVASLEVSIKNSLNESFGVDALQDGIKDLQDSISSTLAIALAYDEELDMGKKKDLSKFFIEVNEDGKHFAVNGQPFYVAGSNCLHLMSLAADTVTRKGVISILDAAKAAGLNVIRMFAFKDGPGGLQYAPGEFDEAIFEALDFVVHEATKRKLRLILVLTNYGRECGGMSQYRRWSCQRRNVEEDDKAESFYDDPRCQDIFQMSIVKLIDRENQHSKVLYREDPTIMAWSLANEPRCQGDYSGSKLQDWAAATAEFVKSLDPNHLVTMDVEGFLGGASADYVKDNPFDAINLGVDFFRNFTLENLDYATIQIWPDEWTPCADEDHLMRFTRRWIDCHVHLCEELGKPLLVSAFGKKPAGSERAAFFQQVYEQVLEHAKSKHAMAGALFYMQSAPGCLKEQDLPYHVYLDVPQGSDAGGAEEGQHDSEEKDSGHLSPPRASSPKTLSPTNSIKNFKSATTPEDDEDTIQVILGVANACQKLNKGQKADCVIM